jgi:hypothetical protein
MSGVLLGWLGPFVHRCRYPLTGHIEKLIPKLRVFRQSSEPHAVARVRFTFVVGSHDGAPDLRRERDWVSQPPAPGAILVSLDGAAADDGTNRTLNSG